MGIERTKKESERRDLIALDVLLAWLRHEADATFTPESIATYCQAAYAFADAFLSESVRATEGEEIDASYTVIDTNEEPEAEPEIDTKCKATLTKCIEAEAQAVYRAYPRKDNKVKGIESIIKVLTGASKVEPWAFDDLLRRTRQYAADNPLLRRSHPDYKTAHPHPSTWFNQRRFEDEQFDEGAAEAKSDNPFLASLQENADAQG